MQTKANRQKRAGLIITVVLLLSLHGYGQHRRQCDSLIDVGISAWQNQQHSRSIAILQQALAMARDQRWYSQEFRAINNIGANYHSLLMYGEALDCYLKSYTIALQHLGTAEEMVVMNNIAIIYSEEGNYGKARAYFEKAYQAAMALQNRNRMGLYLINMAQLATDTHDYGQAIQHVEKAIPLVKEQPGLLLQGRIIHALATLGTGDTHQARQMASELLKAPVPTVANRNSLLHLVALSHMQDKEYAKAVASIKAMAPQPTDYETQLNIYEMFSEAYAGSGNKTLALQYKDSVIAMILKTEKRKGRELLKNAEAKLNIQEQRSKMALNTERAAAARQLFIATLCGVLAIAVIILLFVLNRAAKQKQKRLLAEKALQETELNLEKEKNAILNLEKQLQDKEMAAIQEEENHRNELEASNRKISAKALYIATRNDLIRELIDQVTAVPEIAGSRVMKGHIKKINTYLEGGEEWESFLTHFEMVNHRFISKIKEIHPDLTANDIRFLSYIFMNMNTREIASLLGITDDACRKRKERMRSKLGLSKTSSLYTYVASL